MRCARRVTAARGSSSETDLRADTLLPAHSPAEAPHQAPILGHLSRCCRLALQHQPMPLPPKHRRMLQSSVEAKGSGSSSDGRKARTFVGAYTSIVLASREFCAHAGSSHSLTQLGSLSVAGGSRAAGSQEGRRERERERAKKGIGKQQQQQHTISFSLTCFSRNSIRKKSSLSLCSGLWSSLLFFSNKSSRKKRERRQRVRQT